MNKHKFLSKINLCMTSLLMMTSLGAGINNVSARKTHHSNFRTYHVTMTSRNLYKLAYHQSKHYISLLSLPFESDKPVPKSYGSKIDHARQELVKDIIKHHFNKSYIRGLYPLNTAHNFGEGNNQRGMVKSAKQYAKKISYKNNHKHTIKRSHKNVKSSTRKKRKLTKSVKRNKRNNKHYLHKQNKHMNKKSAKRADSSKKIPFMDISLGYGVNKVTPKVKSIFARQTQIEMLKDINLARAKSGLKPLTFSNDLTSQANKDANDYMKSDYINSTYGAIGLNPNNDSENLLQSVLVSDPTENHDMDVNSYSFNGRSEHGDSDNDGTTYMNDNGTDDADEDMDDIFSGNVHDNYEDEGTSEMKDNVLNPNYTSVGIGTSDNYSNNYNNGYGDIFVAQLFK